jgi:hypothetical protein
MQIPNDAMILKRAKEFCEQNGATWAIEFTVDHLVSRDRPILDDRDRRRYLTRAREQLLSEQGDA